MNDNLLNIDNSSQPTRDDIRRIENYLSAINENLITIGQILRGDDDEIDEQTQPQSDTY
ncbi:hypothetical protein HED60_19400 [Planctomycetales bacterium ZRK34]|nr:hypothetical protein HED60_19400 [Planctomycetales bacterium ZRK34]